jgi:hypothetical protein
MAIKTFPDLRADMPANTIGAVSRADIINLTDTVEDVLTSLTARVSTLEVTVSSPISVKTANYTATAADDKRRITFNSPTPVTFTLPATLVAGWECSILQLGEGQVTVAVSGTGAALNARGGHTKLFGQFSSGYLMVYENAGAAPQVAFSGDTAS